MCYYYIRKAKGMAKMEKVIAVIGLTNTSSLNIYDVNDEEIIVGLNNQTPRTYKLYHTTKGVYFNFKGSRYYLHDAIRV